MENLWPIEIEFEGLKAPVTILREQATLLGDKTKNIVLAEVQESSQIAISEIQFDFIFYFNIVAPALGNYRYRLFKIGYQIDLYPLSIYIDSDIIKDLAKNNILTGDPKIKIGGPVIVKTEKEFVELLRAIFNTEKTKRVLAAILAQSA